MPGKIERDDAAAVELCGNGVIDDRLGDAVDDRGLSDTGLADQYRVVLGAPTEDLDGLLDLVGPTDHRVERAFAGTSGEVGAVCVEHGRIGCCRLRPRALSADRRGDVLAHTLREGFGGDAGFGQHSPCGHVLSEHEREEEVLGVDVGGAGRAGDLVGVEERAARARGDGGGAGVRGFARHRQSRFHGLDDLLGRHADVLDGAHDGVVLDDHAQHVQGVELGLAAFEGEAACALQDLLGARGQEPAEVDGSGLPGLLAREIPSQELVERAGPGVAVFVRQCVLLKVERMSLRYEVECTSLNLNAAPSELFPEAE